MTTVARPPARHEAGWYTTKGDPLYTIPKADGKGVRAPTLADAKKRGDLLPRVSTILNLLDKPALNDWKIEQAVLAVMTSKQLTGETTDAFVHRVLHVERVQDQEAATARDRGTEIHSALQAIFNGEDVPDDIKPWTIPAAAAVSELGERVCSEKILVGKGYAGRTDLIQESPDCWWIVDFKTTKKLPEKGSWFEHVLQLAAYAAAYQELLTVMGFPPPGKPIRTANVYLSTIEPGQFKILENDPNWQKAYNEAFKPLVSVWQYLNSYKAQQ